MRFLITLSLFILSSSFSILGAQSFTQKLTSKTNGSVTLHQDQRLTNIIDGVATTQSSEDEPTAVQTGKKTKVKGWRIQMYSGDSSDKSLAEAKKAGNAVTRLFPELQSYVDFYNVSRRCRVGDFRSKEKAAEYLEKIREAGLGKEAMIVRSEIFIYVQ
ncbi:MAG: SPOR domain-containing protein [Bacteroidaceae bacterium]|nr:SPOR domain-containing protein [Bacteroidaceae bacterium]